MCNQSRLRSMALDSSGNQSEQQQPRASSGNGEVGLKLRRIPNEEHEPDNYEDLQLDFSPVLFSSLERYLPEQLLNSSRIEKARFMRDLLLRYSPDTERIRVKFLPFSDILDSWSFRFLKLSLNLYLISSWKQIQRHREYRLKILSSYQVAFFFGLGKRVSISIVSLNLFASCSSDFCQRLHGEIYSLDPASFFVPSFLEAVRQKSEESFRSILVSPSPGIFTFEMLHPRFCQMLLAEV